MKVASQSTIFKNEFLLLIRVDKNYLFLMFKKSNVYSLSCLSCEIIT